MNKKDQKPKYAMKGLSEKNKNMRQDSDSDGSFESIDPKTIGKSKT